MVLLIVTWQAELCNRLPPPKTPSVLNGTARYRGKPASIMTDRGFQFYVTVSEAKKKSVSKFKKRLVDLDTMLILGDVRYPQTNGKLERLHEFEATMVRKSDPAHMQRHEYLTLSSSSCP